jgi:hypothetical protein
MVPSLKLEYMPRTCGHFAATSTLGIRFGELGTKPAMGANRRMVRQREDGCWEVKAPHADRAVAEIVPDTQAAGRRQR